MLLILEYYFFISLLRYLGIHFFCTYIYNVVWIDSIFCFVWIQNPDFDLLIYSLCLTLFTATDIGRGEDVVTLYFNSSANVFTFFWAQNKIELILQYKILVSYSFGKLFYWLDLKF